MASIVQRIRAFLSSPQGQRLVTRGRQEVAKPQNQQRLRGLVNRFNRRR
jgi:hypothetical protein